MKRSHTCCNKSYKKNHLNRDDTCTKCIPCKLDGCKFVKGTNGHHMIHKDGCPSKICDECASCVCQGCELCRERYIKTDGQDLARLNCRFGTDCGYRWCGPWCAFPKGEEFGLKD